MMQIIFFVDKKYTGKWLDLISVPANVADGGPAGTDSKPSVC